MKSIVSPGFLRGYSYFDEMRQRCAGSSTLTMADKTGFLPELLSLDNKSAIFTRPSLFMKTSTLSMRDKFLSIKNAEINRSLFDGMAIDGAAHSEFRSQYQGKFPVIFIRLENIKTRSWSEVQIKFSDVVADLYEEHKDVLPSLTERQQEKY